MNAEEAVRLWNGTMDVDGLSRWQIVEMLDALTNFYESATEVTTTSVEVKE